MHITFLTSANLATGGARQALYLARDLKKAGHRINFVAPEGGEVFTLAEDLKPIPLPQGIGRADKLLRSLPETGRGMVIHAFHNWGVKLTAYLGTWWRIKGVPIVCAAHRGVTSRPGNPLPFLLPGIRAYIVNSSITARRMPLLWRRKRCHLVSNSIPPERLAVTATVSEMRRELNVPEGQMIIGDVAHDKPEKGVAELLKAYAGAREHIPPSVLVVVGIKPHLWADLCRELDLTEHVRLVSRTERVADYVQTFDLYVFPSYFIESQPNVLMEAVSLGIPVIAGDIGGVPDMIEQRFLFRPGDIDSCRNKLVEVANQSGLLKVMAAENAAKRAWFASERRVDSVLGIYRNILAEAGLKE